MLAATEGLIAELRAIGIPISVSENIDALRSLTHIRMAHRGEVKASLRAALVKDHEYERAFDIVFDLFFAPPVGGVVGGADSGTDQEPPEDRHTASRGGLAALDDRQISRLLVGALRADDATTVRIIAGILVDRHARIVPGRPAAGTYYLFRTMRAVEEDSLLAALLEKEPTDGEAPAAALRHRLAAEQAEARVERFRAEVEAAIRHRLVADRGAEAVARTLRTPLPQDTDFLHASQQQLTELRATVRPLAGMLAGRLAQRRRQHRHGGLDFRRTVRRSMSVGGVPAQPVFRKPRPAKPELIVIADISGSVSTFAAFTLQLVDALRTQFAKVRSFVFVDGVDEVTDMLARATDIADVGRQINEAGAGVWLDGRSDYGHALETFWERWGSQLKSRSTVVVLGDARTNYHAPRADVLAAIRSRAGRLYWLNPEPAPAWDDGDSVMSAYARHCDGVFECRTVRQLKDAIDTMG